MNIRRKYPLMNAAGEFDAGGGAAVIDRGDSIEQDKAVDKAKVDAQAEKDVRDAGLAQPDKTEKTEPEKSETPRGDDGRFIPKARFDEQLGKERSTREAAEARAAELESQLKKFQQHEDTAKLDERISELEDKLESARLDGNKDEALRMSKELRLLERQIRVSESTQMSQQAKAEAYESMRVDIMVERLEGQYDELNPNSDSYDEFLIERTLDRQNKLIRTGIPPSKALQQAAEETMGWYRGKLAGREVRGETGLSAATAADSRKEAQVVKNLDTQKRQPASMNEAGMDSDKGGIKGQIDVTKLTADEFNALPESTKAKLRGDLL